MNTLNAKHLSTSGAFNNENVQKYVQKMTNWQRKQWQKNGSKIDVINLEYYSTLRKNPDSVAATKSHVEVVPTCPRCHPDVVEVVPENSYVEVVLIPEETLENSTVEEIVETP